jgi:thioesterase domain-containing protein
MLAGNPALFAPPELELLGFNTLRERRAAFSGKYAFWAEGTVRALMELGGESAGEAEAEMAEFEARDLAVRDFYAELEARTGGRMLVDKTPSYALDRATLARAEEDFEEPLYLHLLRHPHGMIRSFTQAKLDQVFFRVPHSFTRRELAELIWVTAERNIREHLATVPPRRQLALSFEDLVRDPEAAMRRVCDFLGLAFDPAMLDPYAPPGGAGDSGGGRMTDGIHALSKMLGDVKFHEHRKVDAAVAESWKREVQEDFLGEPTWRIAEILGYPRPAPVRRFSPLVTLAEGGPGRPLFLVHPVGGNVLCYGDLARRLAGRRPVYGLQARGLGEEEPERRVEEMAATYLEALRAVQPEGPYLLGGWSIGGVLAWEMAQQLRRQGSAVDLLALLDSVVPGRLGQEAPIDEADLLAGLALDLGESAGRPLELTAAALRALPAEGRLAAFLQAARNAGALPAGMGERQAGRLLRVFTANVEAARSYRPEPCSGPVLLVRAGRRPEGADGADATLGWGSLAPGLATTVVDADHYGLLREPALEELIQVFEDALRAP